MNNRVAFLFCFLPISRSEHTALYQRSLGKSNTRTAFPFLGRCSAGAFSIHELITGLCRSFCRTAQKQR